jgi:hypothetical protein
MPNCKPGDLALVMGKLDFAGMVVKVIQPTGKMISCRDHFHYLHRGIDVVLVSTRVWICEGDFSVHKDGKFYDIPDAPIEDCYLIPIRPSDEKLDEVTKFEDNLAQKLKDNLVYSLHKKLFDKEKSVFPLKEKGSSW